jgi:hypothetical protein
VVSWNPSKTKDRLNAKNNVSLYSRNSLQSNIKQNELKTGVLSNGEKIILFRRENFKMFFEKLPILFHDNQIEIKVDLDVVSEPIEVLNPEKLYEITALHILDLINPLLEKNRVLEAVEVCTKYYSDKFPNMTFKEWFTLVNKQYKLVGKFNNQ